MLPIVILTQNGKWRFNRNTQASITCRIRQVASRSHVAHRRRVRPSNAGTYPRNPRRGQQPSFVWPRTIARSAVPVIVTTNVYVQSFALTAFVQVLVAPCVHVIPAERKSATAAAALMGLA